MVSDHLAVHADIRRNPPWNSVLSRSFVVLAFMGGLLLTTAPAGAFTILHSHQSGESTSYASLLPDGSGNLYGTTYVGGASNLGTVFKVKTDGTGFQLVHSFAGDPSDGKNPQASLIFDSSGNLYGTTLRGGSSDAGTVFKIKGDGTGFQLLHSFAGALSDGSMPYASLILDGSANLYGTTSSGGSANLGTVFSVKTDGTGFQLLHSFTGASSDGSTPYASLILDGSGNLYATTTSGGSANLGTVFSVKTDGTGFQLLHSFIGGASDGINPQPSLILDGSGNLYGTTTSRYPSTLGTVFSVKKDGTGFQLLHSFAGGVNDGTNPQASLILDGSGSLYGTTDSGGSSDLGTVFSVKTDGTGFQLLHSFIGGASDGINPRAALILDGSANLYGTTSGGGSSNGGIIFKVKVDGTGFQLLHSFAGASSDGANPYASLILDGSGNLYGTTYYGGSSNAGTVFTVRTDGTGFQLLHSFAGGANGGAPQASLILDGSGNLYGTTYYTVFKIRVDGSGFQLLHSFAGGASDGLNPQASLILDGSGNLYGTTYYGGSSDVGTVFKLKSDGSGFQLLHLFSGSDGSRPQAALILDGSGNLYGTTYNGTGSASGGTVFKVKTDGTGFQLLHLFTGGASEGNAPVASLILDGSGNLYGTTLSGGSSDLGTVFKLKTDGTGFQLLHSFGGASSEGRNPYASLVLDGSGNLYGTTSSGGSSGLGTVFTLETDGTRFQLLHSFAGSPNDGEGPFASLILSDFGNLYGTTSRGGSSNFGTEFTLAAIVVPSVLVIDDVPGDARFRAQVTWATTQGGNDGLPHAGQPISTASLGVNRGGLFWFFQPDNPEMLLKVLNGCGVNGKYWVFTSAGTNVGLTTKVTDSFSGLVKTYTNPDQSPAVPVLDTTAFPCSARPAGVSSPVATTAASVAGSARVTARAVEKVKAFAAPSQCLPDSATLCIDDQTGDARFRVKVNWSTVQGGGQSGTGTAIATASVGVKRGGLFWFFAADNPEMLVKVLNGCSINGQFWVFTSAGTNVGLTTTVTDTMTGAVKTYLNPDVTPAAPVQDVAAFVCK